MNPTYIIILILCYFSGLALKFAIDSQSILMGLGAIVLAYLGGIIMGYKIICDWHRDAE